MINKVRALANPQQTVIIDAPPGTSCPVVAATRQTDFILLVTEPTPFGLHDLKLTVEVVKTLHVPCGVVINRWGVGSAEVETYLAKEGIPVLMKIPFEREIAEIYSRGDILVEVIPEWRDRFLALYDQVRDLTVHQRRSA